MVEVEFEVADDLRSVAGRETVTFTPDLPVCELVFRAWPNKPGTARTGNSLVVTGARVDGAAATPQVEAAGAPDGLPGTLVRVPLASCADAGDGITAELTFSLVLGPGTDERVGVALEEEMAWFATAFPLLAWERGRGWAVDDAVDVVGEMATSETFELRSLEVEAPSRYQVLGTGAAGAVRADPEAGTTVHRFTAPAVRDIAVTVGRMRTLSRDVDGVRLHLGGPSAGSQVPLQEWADSTEGSMRRLTWLLGGPFPYSDLWISVLPHVTDGVEFTGAIQYGDGQPIPPGLVSHEVAHMWFYGLVGNNQARDPWLDEAFASYAQRIADGRASPRFDATITDDVALRVGRPMSSWEGYDPNADSAQYASASRAYVRGVYVAGGSALLEARRRSGTREFDAALRAYLRDNAHEIADPADVRAAFAGLPAAVAVLEDAGALPRGSRAPRSGAVPQ